MMIYEFPSKITMKTIFISYLDFDIYKVALVKIDVLLCIAK